MSPSIGDLINALLKVLKRIRELFRKHPGMFTKALKVVTGLIFFVRGLAKAAGPLRLAGTVSRGFLPLSIATSILSVLIAEDKIDELAKEVCSLALGFAGSVIGGAVGGLCSPIGAYVGFWVGGAIGGLLGWWVYARLKGLFTEGMDGVRPIDRIVDRLWSRGFGRGYWRPYGGF
ncbi:unnamed protein product [Tuber aestivum]|uniref:Uncharacterized protein n=1 Tax=Tuber aestivum TaxID=59557 RepID=A0A292PVW2_9PEZI|nr:unnamed protein product [Tuber aestivum]